MWYRMIKSFKFVHVEDVLVRYRVHSSQESKKNPQAITEGNALYIRMMEELPSNRKKDLEGSELEFYKQMVFYLKQTPYKEAMNFANKKANEGRIKNDKSEVDYSKALHIPEKNILKDKIKFVFFSPIKFLKKYLG